MELDQERVDRTKMRRTAGVDLRSRDEDQSVVCSRAERGGDWERDEGQQRVEQGLHQNKMVRQRVAGRENIEHRDRQAVEEHREVLESRPA